MNNLFSYFLFVVAFVFLFSSCKIGEETIRKRPLGQKTTRFLLKELQKNEFDFEWLSMKASSQLTTEDKTSSFRAALRLRKDSLIWISVSPLIGMEVARVCISPDSVKMINRISNNYFVGDYAYLERYFNIDIDFETIQSLIVGNSVGLMEEDDKLKTSVDDPYYLISTFRKRKLRKKIERSRIDDILHSVWLEPDSFKVAKISVHDLKVNKALLADYSQFKKVADKLLPHESEIKVEGGSPVMLKSSFSRVKINEPLRFPFRIPDKYEQIY